MAWLTRASQAMSTVKPPRARKPLTRPAGQAFGSAGSNWISPACDCSSISAMPEVPPRPGRTVKVRLPGGTVRAVRVSILDTRDTGAAMSCGLGRLRLLEGTRAAALAGATVEASSTYPGHEPELPVGHHGLAGPTHRDVATERPGGAILVVTHEGVIKSLVYWIEHLPGRTCPKPNIQTVVRDVGFRAGLGWRQTLSKKIAIVNPLNPTYGNLIGEL
mgnify:CR=1 FL=1